MQTSNTTGPSLMGMFHQLDQINRSRQISMTRLATAQRINKAAQDPAGLIASEHLRSQIETLDAESRSLQRTSNVVNTADASLGEMSDQLIEARAANVALANSAGLSSGEREALQMQMSYAVQSVDRIARQSNFAGNALLDGNTTLHAGDAELTIAKSDSTELGNVTQGSQSARLSDVGSNELAANPALSESVIDDAFATLLNHRAELGAFNKYSVQSRNNALQVELQNTVGAESQIRDTDYAKEVANLVRTKITGQAAIKAMQVDTQIRKSMFDLVV
jgi:flagellin